MGQGRKAIRTAQFQHGMSERSRAMPLVHESITEQILGAAFGVHNTLGYGFLEKVYQRALQVELQIRGVPALLEPEIKVPYKGCDVGLYKADLLVSGSVLVEIKVAREYRPEDEAQMLNELKATGLRVGLLI